MACTSWGAPPRRVPHGRVSHGGAPPGVFLMGVLLIGVPLMGVYLMGVHLMGVHLIGVYLMGVHLTGVYLMGVHLIGVYLMDVHLIGVYLVASRPRFGGYSQARTLQLVWASWRETQLGRNQLDRYSWTGAGTAGQGPAIRTRQVLDRQGFPMCISICSFPSRIDSNKQCFHNQYMHTCLLRATQLTKAHLSW